MIIVTGAVRFGNGEIERLRSALVGNIEASRKDAGCEAYSYSVDLTEPNLLRIAEIWRDEESMDAHNKKLPELMAALGDAKMDGISVTAYEARYLKNVIGE
ncbi:MAG TPA: putative quinol monooxygenase [Allosphingosinicella sp.]|nr:putative quinol monooxygenase [Allosphingosinicella sp.]